MLKVGDEVVLDNLAGDDGEYVGDSITETGVVISLAPNFEFNVRVKWKNRNVYRYKEKDLSLYIQ